VSELFRIYGVKFVKFIAGCEGTLINSTLGLICRCPGFTPGSRDPWCTCQQTGVWYCWHCGLLMGGSG